MIKEVNAKTLLSNCKNPSMWFGVKYNMNIYRGCQHGCIYCDSRSECYRIENFDDILVKVNAIDLLKAELPRKRVKGTVGTGAMSDPYGPVEKEYRLTGRALEVIAERRFPVHITTKSNLVLRDVETLQEINRIYASVSFTVTAADDELAGKIEPGAPSPTDRFKAMGVLSTLGICTGITLMPVLPFLEDNEENIRDIVIKAKEYGASYIYPSFGMTLRDRQRDYYYRKLDTLFPGIKEKYIKKFGLRYGCGVNHGSKLKQLFYELCKKYGISTSMPSYEKKISAYQLSILDGEG
ncbi:MAG: radical SAM protein [Clostridia bacterium]|nr:radical SAM protein [Clostridia bacterium]